MKLTALNIAIGCCAVFLLASGCEADPRPPIEVSNVRIYAPLPGSQMSVAYLTIANNTADSMTVDAISSPQFRSVEIHKTTMTDDVARMRKIDALTIPPGQSTELHEGAEHLMLTQPIGDASLGDAITLFIRDTSGGEVVVRSTLEARIKLDER